MRIMDTNLCTATGTTVTASTANTHFPVSNLQHAFRSKRWRSTSPTSQWVRYDFQTAEAVDSVVLMWSKEDGIRLSGSAVVKIQANATDVWTSPAVDVTLTVDNTYMLASHYFSTDQSYRYWRVTITDPNNPYGYVELGVVWIGKSLEIENAQNGFKFQLTDRSKTSTTDFGHEYVDEYPQVASLEFSYAYLDYDAVQILEDAYRRNGNRKPVMVVLDADEAVFDKDHFTVYGKLTNSFSLTHVNYNLLNTEGIRVVELA